MQMHGWSRYQSYARISRRMQFNPSLGIFCSTIFSVAMVRAQILAVIMSGWRSITNLQFRFSSSHIYSPASKTAIEWARSATGSTIMFQHPVTITHLCLGCKNIVLGWITP